MSKADDAVSCFNCGFNCAQAVLSSYSEELGMSKEQAFKASCAFGAGMGRMGETCGAVSGAYMVLGLKYGKYKQEDEAAKTKTYDLTREFAARFRARNGSTLCRELLGHDIGTPDGFKAIKEKGLTTTLCPKYVRDAAEIVGELI